MSSSPVYYILYFCLRKGKLNDTLELHRMLKLKFEKKIDVFSDMYVYMPSEVSYNHKSNVL